MATERLFITHATLVTLGEENLVWPDAAVLVEDGRIRRIGDPPALEGQARGAPRLDLGGKVLMPGNINAHDHLYSALARGIALKDHPPQNFPQILERLWWRLDRALEEEDVYVSALLGFCEAARRGTTTVIDHHASPSFIEGSLDTLARAAREVGLRGCFCYEVTDRNGPEGARRGIQENARWLRRCRQERDPTLAGAFGLHASFTVSRATLQSALEAAPSRDTFFHVHVAEDPCDVIHSKENYGSPPLKRLLVEGLADFPVLAAHCIHLEEQEFPLLATHDVSVLHNPESNMNNAVGCAAVRRMLHAGVVVGLGTDGMTQDMFQEMRVLPLAHRLVARHPQAFGYDEVYRLAYRHNPAIAGRLFGERLGEVRVGAAADLVVLDYAPPTPLEGRNFMGHLIFGLASAPVETVLVAGRIIVQEGRLVTVDQEEVAARARERAAALWRRW